MQINEIIRGFRVLRVRPLEELQARLVEMEHVRTGAKLCWLDRRDENKAFSIAFKTLPEDSTGVFHILEHSVLCGSEKYPVKEPFVELLKSSVQTFLNALTYPDKTVYPVSTRNDKDFLNLIDVYLDAVLHPAIYSRPEIFRQEGWRYEGEGDALCYQGVVFNEMKGSMASPMNVLAQAISAHLFPDSPYRFNSGGDPACIPDLTYEQFIACHRKYYHPSNARVSLVGSVDLEPVLEKIDSFFSAFDRQEADFPIPVQKPVAAVTKTVPYEIGAEESTEKRTLISASKLLWAYDDLEKLYGASILKDYLAGDNDSPLKRAVLDSGLTQDFRLGLDAGCQQAGFSWIATNTEPENLEGLRKVIRDTVSAILDKGLDRALLRACCHRFAFQKLDREAGWANRSLLEAVGMLNTWLYGGDPAGTLIVEPYLQSLEKKLDTDWFRDLLRELFLEEEHTVTVVLVPSREAGEETRAKEAARLQGETAGWTEADRARLQKEAETLRLWQQTPDSPEALARIPMLKLADLPEKPEPLRAREMKLRDVTLLRHEVTTPIADLCVLFRAGDLRLEELPTLAWLCGMLGSMATKKHRRSELSLVQRDILGSLNIHPLVVEGSTWKTCRLYLSADVSCLPEMAEEASALLGELFTETVWEDRELLREQLRQDLADAMMNLASDGMTYASTRLGGTASSLGRAREQIKGITMLKWLEEVTDGGEAALDRLLADIAAMAQRLFTRDRMILSVSPAYPDHALETLLDLIPSDGVLPPQETVYPFSGSLREGILIPGQVGYALMGDRYLMDCERLTGKNYVLENVLNYMYLWNEIRVKGGAYGCGFVSNLTYPGSVPVSFYSYRDPQPARSLEVYGGAADFLRAFCASAPDLTGPILSSVSSLDPMMNSREKMDAGVKRWLRGISQEEVDRWYYNLIHTTPEDLLAFLPALETVREKRSLCVAAGKELLDACGDLLEEIVTP